MSIPANRVEELNRTIAQEGQTLESLEDRRIKTQKQVDELSLLISHCKHQIEQAELELKVLGEASYENRDI